MIRKRWLLLAPFFVIACSCAVRFPLTAASCTGANAHLEVDTGRHVMSVCENGEVRAWYSVRLGRGGQGKTREGDGRTPIGSYALLAPQPSDKFKWFIPVGYPTEAQRREGYTGTAIGVHGPPRWARWLGPFTNIADTTEGCIGVWSDDTALSLSTWARTHPTAMIVIR